MKSVERSISRGETRCPQRLRPGWGPRVSGQETSGFARIPDFRPSGAARSATQNNEQEKTLDSRRPLHRRASPHLDGIESTVAVETNGAAYNDDGKSAWQRHIYPIPKLNDLKTQTAEDLRQPPCED